MKTLKRRIKRNVWGNWLGYEGTRRVEEFGTQEWDAKEWLIYHNSDCFCLLKAKYPMTVNHVS